MFRLLYPLVHALQPYLVPVCFFLTWGLVILLVWTIWTAMRDSLTVAKRMHQIPCTGCKFFTDDYRLKCTVHPKTANTEAAINCSDYRSNTNQIGVI